MLSRRGVFKEIAGCNGGRIAMGVRGKRDTAAKIAGTTWVVAAIGHAIALIGHLLHAIDQGHPGITTALTARGGYGIEGLVFPIAFALEA